MNEDQFVELVWQEMRNQCAVNPAVAKRLVLVNEENVREAMKQVLQKVELKKAE